MTFLRPAAEQTLSVIDLILSDFSPDERARALHPVHASALTDQERRFCPREVVLTKRLDLKPPLRSIPHALRVTWDEGRDKQARVNNHYLRSRMIGQWHCTRCGLDSAWGKVPYGNEGACLRARSQHRWEYKEPVFTHKSGIVGSVDGIVAFTDLRHRVLEVKIIKSDEFRLLKAPLAEHRVRTRLYLKLIAEGKPKKNVDTSVGHVLYIMRGHGTMDPRYGITPFKEFIVERDDKEVQPYFDAAERVSDALDRGIYPKGICSSIKDDRAAACWACKQCFSGEYPSQ